MIGRFATLLALVTLAAGCAAEAPADEGDSSADALSGRVTAGRVVQTIGDALRLRRAPTRTMTANILAVLPKGTSLRIVDGVPDDGFYQVELVDAALAKKVGAKRGWVYGEYLNGESEEPEDPDQSKTGTWDVPTQMRAKLVVARCDALRDDQGNAFAPPVEDAVSGKSAFAAAAFDTNTFAYGMKATIAQLDAKNALNPSGKALKLKVLKTAGSAPDGPFTVTICTRTGNDPGIADAEGFVDVSVYAYW